jgi:signal peptidase I
MAEGRQEAAETTPSPGGAGARPQEKKDRAAEVANTFEWLITAFILAFVFRAFVMEAFRIPTGSMADTLMGAHFEVRCPQCGYRYEYGFAPENNPAYYRLHLGPDELPPGPVPTDLPTRCPSCGYYSTQIPLFVCNGDRILVLKCIYQFAAPRRWDVVVFKNPTTPTENYIKRLVGLPGEKIEIIDGDVYINGQIARKPPQVQEELWMPVCDFDYQPVDPNHGTFNGKRWTPAFDLAASAWRVSRDNPTRLVLDSPPDQSSTLTYGSASANDFRVVYAYNRIDMIHYAATCSDLMVRFDAQADSRAGRVGVTLSKYGVDYRAWWDLTGRMVLARVDGDKETVLDSRLTDAPKAGQFARFNFANVDHQLLFEVNGDRLQVDLGSSPTALRRADVPPRAEIFGAGTLALAHIGVFRDIYYTNTSSEKRATEGHPPFQLQKDEFFVLGDNSPNSWDARCWDRPPVATKGTEPPRAGVVPRYYLVGKAMFVYWPSGFEFPWPTALKDFALRSHSDNPQNGPANILHWMTSLRWIPNFGRMRFIYGGTRPENAGDAVLVARTHEAGQ